jgi:hypothetical protein
VNTVDTVLCDARRNGRERVTLGRSNHSAAILTRTGAAIQRTPIFSMIAILRASGSSVAKSSGATTAP